MPLRSQNLERQHVTGGKKTLLGSRGGIWRHHPLFVTRCGPMSFGTPVRVLALAMAFGIGCVGCSGGTQFNVQYANGYAPSTGSVSVFGVFENGRLSPEAWHDLGALLSSSLGGRQCESLWTEAFRVNHTALANAVEDYARDDGISDKLLHEMSPMARGTSILSFTVHGSLASAKPAEGDKKGASPNRPAPVRPPSQTSMARGGLGNTGWSTPSLRNSPDDATSYDISAVLYSVPQRRSVVLLSMTHQGSELNEALEKFAAKMREALGNRTCIGWNSELAIDPAVVRALIEASVPNVEPRDEQ